MMAPRFPPPSGGVGVVVRRHGYHSGARCPPLRVRSGTAPLLYIRA